MRDSNLWVVNVATGEAKPLTTGGSEEILKGQLDWVYPEELDATTAYWWSPDSSKIAYYQMDERPVTRYPIMDMSSPIGAIEYTRFPQAGEANPIVRVGVVSVAGGETKWMDTGADTDVYLPRVVWLRDSRRVAIERLNRAQNRLDLLFCDAATGASRNNSHRNRQILDQHRRRSLLLLGQQALPLVERALPASATTISTIFPGSSSSSSPAAIGELPATAALVRASGSHPAVDEAHGYIYFLSNKDDVLDTQLYRLSLRTKAITRITREDGTHDVLIAPDASAFVDTYSNAMTPPRQDLYRMDGTRAAVINENKVRELAEYHLSPVEFLDLAANDGTKLSRLDHPAAGFRRFAKISRADQRVWRAAGSNACDNEWDTDPEFLWLRDDGRKGLHHFHAR